MAMIDLCRRVAARMSHLTASVRTILRRRINRSDFRRWGTEANLHPAWDSRTLQIARLIPPGSSVLEFGAGRLVLRESLPPGCVYTPSDLVDRGFGTIVCDLNARTLPSLGHYDVAVFSGVLEYVNDVPRLIRHLSRSVDMIIASYSPTETNPCNRRAGGWVNDYDSDELRRLFAAEGFACGHTEPWAQQTIFVFTRRAGGA